MTKTILIDLVYRVCIYEISKLGSRYSAAEIAKENVILTQRVDSLSLPPPKKNKNNVTLCDVSGAD